MKCVFLSNYFNHHQKPFSDEMYLILKGDFYFIETVPMTNERISLGWEIKDLPTYVLRYYESKDMQKKCLEVINQADFIITGSAPEVLLEKALKKGCLVFRYSERPIKSRDWYFLKYPIRYVKWHMRNKKDYNVFLLCSSAFTLYDYSKFGLFENKAFKWGYFPEVKYYSIKEILSLKVENSILWAGRLIDVKHPEVVIDLAYKLKEYGYKYKINVIGNGKLFQNIEKAISDKHLENNIVLLGAMKPDEVRRYMEFSKIFLFTSDRREGWGAVVNEAMNSGCIVIASSTAGSVPYLIDNNRNGFIYKDNEDLFHKVKYCLDNPDKTNFIGYSAYKDICEKWSPKNAAVSICRLAKSLLQNNTNVIYEKSGPCSKAEILNDNWYES